jgi:hypothetical protein
MKKLVELNDPPAFHPIIDSPRAFMGQDRERLALAVLLRESGERLLACRVLPQDEDRGFRDGPLEIGIAHFRACGPVAFAGRFFGPLAQAAVGDKPLDAGETRDVMELIQQHEAQDCANPGSRLEQVERLGLVLLGGFEEVSLQVAAQLVIVGDQGEVYFHALLHRSIGKPRSDARAVGFGGQLLPNLGEVLLAIGMLDVAQQLRPPPGAIHPAPQQVAGRTPLGRLDIRLREHPAPEQHGHLLRIELIALGLTPMNGFHGERVAEARRESPPERRGQRASTR